MVKTLRNLAVVFAAATVGVSAMAQSEILKSSYTGTLAVSLTQDGVKTDCTPTTETIAIDVIDDEVVDFKLNNFVLNQPNEDPMYVGNVVVRLSVVGSGDNVVLSCPRKQITIAEGNLSGIGDEAWVGPNLTKDGDKIYVTVNGTANKSGGIDIDIKIEFVGFDAIDVKFVKSVSTAVESITIDNVYEIYSITGALVAKGEGAVNMNVLDKGIYLVKKNGKTQKIVK
ncbi:MAG: calycin-like domain-containing protein [Bacteroidales bacterium]|nr:calycin-like domain-containing protein [Bacteroidales bacterium]